MVAATSGGSLSRRGRRGRGRMFRALAGWGCGCCGCCRCWAGAGAGDVAGKLGVAIVHGPLPSSRLICDPADQKKACDDDIGDERLSMAFDVRVPCPRGTKTGTLKCFSSPTSERVKKRIYGVKESLLLKNWKSKESQGCDSGIVMTRIDLLSGRLVVCLLACLFACLLHVPSVECSVDVRRLCVIGSESVRVPGR
jgi:hypothetical protein